MSNGAVNVSVPISTQDKVDTNAGNGSSWGGFGGTWTVNQKGSGVQPVWIVAALGLGLAMVYLLKRKKG